MFFEHLKLLIYPAKFMIINDDFYPFMYQNTQRLLFGIMPSLKTTYSFWNIFYENFAMF